MDEKIFIVREGGFVSFVSRHQSSVLSSIGTCVCRDILYSTSQMDGGMGMEEVLDRDTMTHPATTE